VAKPTDPQVNTDTDKTDAIPLYIARKDDQLLSFEENLVINKKIGTADVVAPILSATMSSAPRSYLPLASHRSFMILSSTSSAAQ